MNYYGMMDGWHGDEMECHGFCGTCVDCNNHFDQKCDDDYEMSRNDE